MSEVEVMVFSCDVDELLVSAIIGACACARRRRLPGHDAGPADVFARGLLPGPRRARFSSGGPGPRNLPRVRGEGPGPGHLKALAEIYTIHIFAQISWNLVFYFSPYIFSTAFQLFAIFSSHVSIFISLFSNRSSSQISKFQLKIVSFFAKMLMFGLKMS